MAVKHLRVKNFFAVVKCFWPSALAGRWYSSTLTERMRHHSIASFHHLFKSKGTPCQE